MSTPCPDEVVLRGLLDSSLPEPVQGEVVAHLDGCSSCQGRLEQFAAGESLVLETAKSARVNGSPDQSSAFWPALKSVEKAILTPVGAMTVTRLDAKAKIDSSAALDFSFLEPAEEPGYIGQLGVHLVEELVGRGGMGMVFRAIDPCLGRTVAIKLLDPQYARNDQARQRFLREARASAGIAHENVVTIHRVDCDESRGLSFIVMQFVRGRSLQELLDQTGPLPVREAVRIAAATASGLAAAHESSLIHRDVKPGNILIEEPSGRVLLTDFGLARLTDDVKLTQTGLVAGTPLYMSPEQARGESVDHRSDLFSLGSVLYAMLSGTPPFPGSSPLGVLKQVTDDEPRPIQEHNGAVPDSLAHVLERLLEKDPANRFTSASAAAAALTEELQKLPAQPLLPSPGRTTVRVARRTVKPWWKQTSSRLLAAAIALLAIIGISEATQLTRWTVLGQRGGGLPETRVDPTTPIVPLASLAETPTRYTLPPGEGAVWAVAFDPCGELIATATEGGSVRFWDSNEGHARGVLNNEKYKSPVWALAFNKDGTQLVTASDDGFVRLWDVKSKREADVDFKHPFPVRSVALSPDGKRMVSGTRNGSVVIWNVETGNKIHTTTGHEGGAVMSVAFSPDGRFVASAGSDKTVRVWEVADGSSRATFSNHAGPVYSVAFDSTSQIVASAGWDHTIRLSDVNTSDQIKVFDVHKDDIWSLAFSAEGKHIVTAGQDGTVKWVNVSTGQVDREFRGHGGPVHSVAVSKVGGMIAAGGRDGTVRVWDVEAK
jgi:predicted Ser/Thr protein kinase